MIDIDSLNKKQLVTFLSKALHVQTTQEACQQRYNEKIESTSNEIVNLITNGNMEELRTKFPEVYNSFNQDKKIKSIDTQIEKSKRKTWFTGWRLIVVCAVAFIGLSLLSKLLYPLVVLSNVTALIFGPIFKIVGFLAYVPLIVGFGYLLLGGLQYFTRKTNKFSEDDKKLANEMAVANNNKLATVQGIVSANVRQTKPVQSAWQSWINTIDNLPTNEIICYKDLPADYHNSGLINKMLRYLDQHRAHNFEDLANLMFKEIREDTRHAELMTSINQGFNNLGNTINASISQMENHLAEIGEKQIKQMEDNHMDQMSMLDAILSEERYQSNLASDTNATAHAAEYDLR